MDAGGLGWKSPGPVWGTGGQDGEEGRILFQIPAVPLCVLGECPDLSGALSPRLCDRDSDHACILGS